VLPIDPLTFHTVDAFKSYLNTKTSTQHYFQPHRVILPETRRAWPLCVHPLWEIHFYGRRRQKKKKKKIEEEDQRAFHVLMHAAGRANTE